MNARSRGEALYSDRFIPSRLTSKLEGALSVCAEGPAQANDEPRRHSTGSPRTHTNGSNGSPHVARENQGLMNNLLRAELLGKCYASIDVQHLDDCASSVGHPLASPKTEKTDDSVHTHALAHTQNMLHFQSPKRTYGQWDDTINVLSPASPSILPMSPARDTDFMAPRKVKRKIPKVPFKVRMYGAVKVLHRLNAYAGSGCAFIARRLLPKSRGLVLQQCKFLHAKLCGICIPHVHQFYMWNHSTHDRCLLWGSDLVSTYGVHARRGSQNCVMLALKI
jgi:hypothetical protein